MREDGVYPKMPAKANSDVYCADGGKHKPKGREMRVDGNNVKFEQCTRCHKRVGDRKN